MTSSYGDPITIVKLEIPASFFNIGVLSSKDLSPTTGLGILVLSNMLVCRHSISNGPISMVLWHTFYSLFTMERPRT